MPYPSPQRVPTTARRSRSGIAGRATRIAVGALATLSLLAVPQLSSPSPAAAGSSCTGWTSTQVPPPKIRVLRTRTGTVETVPFRKYVARVMASGEWPSRLRMATLEAGALATKQYAWYYAMQGHHRSFNVAADGCFDVRDDTHDQLYRDSARPTDRQWRAIDKTWALSLRKNGRFFLTGYRTGASSTCAADANGWKLYENSVEACAADGWGFRRILKKYLSPDLSLVWSDKIGPGLSTPKVRLKAGNTVGGGAATVFWKPALKRSNIQRYRVQRKSDGGRWKEVELKRPARGQTDAYVKPDAGTRFRVRAVDSKGNWGHWSYSSRRQAAVKGPAGTTIAGIVGTSAVRSKRVKVRFKGRSVAVVARTGPGTGSIRILINGRRVGVVDLERISPNRRKLVWAKNFPRRKARTVVVKPIGSRERVDFQGFFILR